MAKNLKKKLKKLKRKVKTLQNLNTLTESRLDRLELDIELMHATQADYDIMFEDLTTNQHNIALNAMVKDLSEEELDEVFNELVEEEFLGDPGMDDGFVPDSDKTEQSQDELRNEYHGKFDAYNQQHIINPRQKF